MSVAKLQDTYSEMFDLLGRAEQETYRIKQMITQANENVRATAHELARYKAFVFALQEAYLGYEDSSNAFYGRAGSLIEELEKGNAPTPVTDYR